MARLIYVNINNITELASICYHLAQEGASFVCRLKGNEWEITLS